MSSSQGLAHSQDQAGQVHSTLENSYQRQKQMQPGLGRFCQHPTSPKAPVPEAGLPVVLEGRVWPVLVSIMQIQVL